ncbi:MAG: RlpA-like double-psi beta-barrel domain-containing protein [Actinomycetota bacterium]
MAVRVTRVRRLRIRRTSQFSTLLVGALLMVSVARGAQAQQDPVQRAQPSATPVAVGADQSSTSVGVWVVEGTSSGPAVKAAALDGASASAGGVGLFPAVSVRAVVAGKVYDVITNAPTVGELLSAMGIHPGTDRVRPSLQTPLHSGLTVRLTKIPVPAPVALQPAAGGVAEEVAAPVAAGGHPTTGVATWYDPPWSGLTAASPWLPFGTHVTVTDVDTGRSVVVVINDRGPYGDPSRIIDLSPEAFSRLDSLGRGVINVRIAW